MNKQQVLISDKDDEKPKLGTSLVVQGLRNRASTVGSAGSICSQGTKIPPASRMSKKGGAGGGQYAKTKLLLVGSINGKKLLNVNLSAYMWISKFYTETALYNSVYNE